MRYKHRVKSIGVATLLTCTFSLSTVTAQKSINVAGGNATGSGGSVSYSVGQVVYQTHTGTNGSVTEGIQQPYEISVVTGIDETIGVNISVSAYPNPTTDYLTLKVESGKLKDLCYQLYDINGKILQNEKITGNKTSIAMGNLIPATYFVKVIQNNKELKTYKVIKN